MLPPVMFLAAAPSRALAGPPPGSAPDVRPVIVSGREAEITALFLPHELGGELASGWVLHSFDIQVGTIVVWLAGPSESYAQVRFDHPDYGYAGEPRGHPYDFALLQSRFVDQLALWFRDGLVFLGFVTLTLLGLTVHVLRGCPPWIRWALPVIVLVGAGLRVLLSPEVGLDPWPYSRLIIPAGRFYHFISSITVSSMVFGLLYVVAREPSRVGGWISIVLLALPILLLYQLRPLNILYFPMLVATPFLRQSLYSDRPLEHLPRAITAIVILGILTFGWGVPTLLAARG
jgi:hypothetical protein